MPSQALYLMNNEFVGEQAEAMADWLLDDFEDHNTRVQAAFMAAYSRPASDEEIRGSLNCFKLFRDASSGDSENREDVEQLAFEAFCQALLASAEFRILD